MALVHGYIFEDISTPVHSTCLLKQHRSSPSIVSMYMLYTQDKGVARAAKTTYMAARLSFKLNVKNACYRQKYLKPRFCQILIRSGRTRRKLKKNLKITIMSTVEKQIKDSNYLNYLEGLADNIRYLHCKNVYVNKNKNLNNYYVLFFHFR